jgi:hypothetical protein
MTRGMIATSGKRLAFFGMLNQINSAALHNRIASQRGESEAQEESCCARRKELSLIYLSYRGFRGADRFPIINCAVAFKK